jgi:hypothetical protein
MKECKQRKLIKLIRSLQFGIKEMKSILIYDLFYYVTFDVVGFLLKTNGDKYVLVVIGHHTKWREVQRMKEHYAIIATKFIEEEIICIVGVPIYHEN